MAEGNGMNRGAKIALITGITGQDGALLAELLLQKGYTVHGIKRRSSSFNTGRVDHLYVDPHQAGARFFMHHGDLTDATNLIRIVQETPPTEIYNLAAQSHVQVSFETPEYTANADALGTLRLLEAIRILGMERRIRFYQASSSELYGRVREVPQRETTPFYPRSPYGAAKLYAYWITVNYREAYGMFACNGILFNHESPVRGETFVTRKAGQTVVRVDPHYFRPSEVDSLLGDASKARKMLGWKPEIGFKDLVAEMAREDLALAERDRLARDHGHKTFDYRDERA